MEQFSRRTKFNGHDEKWMDLKESCVANRPFGLQNFDQPLVFRGDYSFVRYKRQQLRKLIGKKLID